MFDGLYLLYDEKQDRWQVRLEDTFYCVSCVQGKDGVVQCIKNLVKKYRTELRLREKLEDTETKGRVGRIESVRQAKLFKDQGHLYRDIVKSAVKEALEEIKMDTTVIKNSKKFKKVNILKETVKTSVKPLDTTTPTTTIKKSAGRRPILGIAKLPI